MRTFPLSTAPRAVSALLSRARRVTLHGPGASALSLQFAAEAACDNSTVTYLCGDNRFDPYAIARLARRCRRRQEDVLARILVARAFTCFQLGELIERLRPEDVSGPVIVTGICSAFLDEDLSHRDAARLFYRVLWRLADLADRGAALLLCESDAIASARRGYFLTDLFQASNFILRLDGTPCYTLEMRHDRALLQ
ncbi:MAG: hypothetical protein SF339_06100 [Blastocatellia bacterium]|nr:hypothetical protein [Blastocatellia bacterium]